MGSNKGKPNYPKSHKPDIEVFREHVNNGPNPSILTQRGQDKKKAEEEAKDKENPDFN